SVSGHVYLRDTAHPLSNVPIELLDPATPQTYSTVSLTDGSFLIPAIAPATYSVSFHGFAPSAPIQLTVGATDLDGQQWILNSDAVISGGVVLSPVGAAVRGATVTAIADDGTEHSTTTDDAGRYTIDSLPA